LIFIKVFVIFLSMSLQTLLLLGLLLPLSESVVLA